MDVASSVDDVNVSLQHSPDGYGVSLEAARNLNLRGLYSGRGVVVSWKAARPPPTIVSLFLLYEKKTEPTSSFGPGKVVMVEAKLNQPATGYVTPKLESFVHAPAIALDIAHGRDINVMILSSPTRTLSVSGERESLKLVEKNWSASASLRFGGGIDGLLTRTGIGSQTVEIAVHRRPSDQVKGAAGVRKTPESRESIASISTAGSTNFRWRPVQSIPAPLAWVFHSGPSESDFISLKEMAAHKQPTDLCVIGDGADLNYELELVGEKRFLGRPRDKIQIKVG